MDRSGQYGVCVGHIGNIKIHISLLFPAVLALLCFWGGENSRAFLCVVASLMHEAGHLIAMLCVGIRPLALCFDAFGMRIVLPQPSTCSYAAQAVAACGGPLESGMAAAVLYACNVPAAAAVHLILCVFNLLPIRPLDGGQILLCLLKRRLSPDRAERIVGAVSVVTVIPLTVLAVLILHISGYNLSLLLVCGYLIFLLLMKKKD